MTAVSGPSFISYVSEAEKNHEVSQKIMKAMNTKFQEPDKELEGRLLPGEIAIGRTSNVLRYNVHDDPARGISGTLVCTNFRLTFLTVEKATYDLIELQNRLLNEHDILLNNIESIFVEYPNKRKRLIPSSMVKDGIQRLELHCKDFRVAAFNFKFSQKGQEKGVITALLHHAYPQKVSRLFAFDYKHDKDLIKGTEFRQLNTGFSQKEKACKVPLYRNQVDWDSELRRCGVTKKMWRVSVVNRNFTALPTMGTYIVVPASVNDSELSSTAGVFSGSRVPVWCWTDGNGCSLSRCPTLGPEVEQQDTEFHLQEAIQKADLQQRPLKIFNVSKLCPSCLHLQQSFNKLKSVCMPATESDFWDTDTHWHSLLNSTKWMQHVSSVLSTAGDAAKSIRQDQHNVIIQENVGVDLTSVVTSLVQVILDPSCRRLDGFQALIQREWVVAGHPFLDRLGHLLQPKKKGRQATVDGDTTQLAPVFLLFLDCVYQLMVQFPARFEPSITFLTVLYDATRMAAFDTFIFNNERHRHKSLCEKEMHDQPYALNEVDRVPTIQFLPLWAWEVQFNKNDMTLFNNPLYRMRTMENYKQYVEESAKILTKSKRFHSDLFWTKKSLGNSMEDLNGDVPDGTMSAVTRPSFAHDITPNDPKRPKSLFNLGGKRKPSLKEMKTEEHRRKMEKDSPHPLNKAKQKSGSLEENKNFTKSGSTGSKSGIMKENNKTPKKEPFRATPGGHYPKVALMPKQYSASKLPAARNGPERRVSRSKSDSEWYDDDDDVTTEGKSDDVMAPNDDVLTKTSDPPSPNLKTRFSLRRRKTKETLEVDDTILDVPSYPINLQDEPVRRRRRAHDQKGSIHALYPSSHPIQLKLWRQCYFRWLPWSQIYGGGPASMLQQESLLYDEIHVLHNKLQRLRRQLHTDSTNIHPAMGEDESSLTSGMYFSKSQENLAVFESKSSSQSSLNILPSYFPYSPVKDLRRKSIIGTPMLNFLQGGSFFNFGRSRGKHSRSASGLSITHSLAQSIEDLASMSITDGNTSSDTTSPPSKSMDDLTADVSRGPEIRDRTQSDVPRERSKLLDPGMQKPRKLTPSPTSTSPPKESITYITSL